MSPEQAKGRAADRRSDIWSFGCVLYEMLAGRRPFDGEDVSDTLAAVLRGEPDWTALPRDVPVQVLMLLRRCLQRDPQKRLPHIGVARLDIEDAIAAPSSTPLPARARRNAVWIRVLPYVAAAAMASVITALVQRGADDGSRPPPPVRRLTILSPAAAAFMPASAGALPNVAISRDGTRIVYVGQAPNGARALYLRALDRLDPIPLPGTANAVDAFFSPDGGSVAFFIDTRGGFANGVLKRVALTGGGTDTVASIDGVTSGGAWGADGTIVFSMASAGGPGIPQSIFVAPAAGGAARPIVKLTGTSERSYGFPEVLPDGQHMLVSVRTGRTYAEAHVEAMTTDGTPVRTVLENGFHARFASGHLLYRLGSNLMAVGFDPARLQTTGAPVTLAENFGAPTPRGDALFDVSQNGVLVYAASSASTEMPRRLLTWVDRTGHEEPVPTPERAYTYPRISPDGGRVALDIRDQDSDIWTLDLTRNVLSRVTLDPAQDFYPTWSPDGKRLAYSSSRSGTFNLYWQSADGSGQAERLTQSSTTQATYAITPDGTRLLFRDGVPRTGEDLMLVSLAGDATASGTRHRVTPLLQTPFNERNGEVSPDGRWLAYESDESGRDEIYERPFPNVDGGRWPISADGGTRPVWARNGRELFYITGATPNPVRVVRVSVETTQGFVPGPPQVLFEGRYYVDPRVAARGRTYDVSPDGQRFLMIKDVESIEKAPTAPLPLVVVLNWQEELKQRAAAR